MFQWSNMTSEDVSSRNFSLSHIPAQANEMNAIKTNQLMQLKVRLGAGSLDRLDPLSEE